MQTEADTLVVGGGILGAAIAFGLARRQKRVILLDEGDVALRAALGNFGLVWVQGKGELSQPYVHWTLRSADLWPQFDAELRETTGIDTEYHRPGGVHFCLNEYEFEARNTKLATIAAMSTGRFSYEMMDHNQTGRLLPGLGETVAGSSYSDADGHVNPMKLMQSLQAAFQLHGGLWLNGAAVEKIRSEHNSFRLTIGEKELSAPQLVLAAGLGNKSLGPMVNIDVPVRPVRGQILVTEKITPFLPLPTSTLNQTEVGSVLLGGSYEQTGFDDSVTPGAMQAIADHATTIFPFLRSKHIVRAWGSLRPLMPDDLPHYEESRTYPGAFVVCSHSGVTLAAIHALKLAGYISDGVLPPELNVFCGDRFHANNNSKQVN